MSTTITHSGGTITPDIIDGYRSTRRGGTIVHPIAGVASPDVTLRVAGLRTGQMRLVFASESDAADAEAALATAEVFILTSTDRDTIPMSFVVPEGGVIERELDDVTRDVWIVTFDFQEVEA